MNHVKFVFLCPFLLHTSLINPTALFTAILKTSAWSNYQYSTSYLSRYIKASHLVLHSSTLLNIHDIYSRLRLFGFTAAFVLWFFRFQGYFFHTNNPYKDYSNAFEQGLQKWREGDLNSAVLLLEAAILQDPQDSEVKASICNLASGEFARSFIKRLYVNSVLTRWAADLDSTRRQKWLLIYAFGQNQRHFCM